MNPSDPSDGWADALDLLLAAYDKGFAAIAAAITALEPPQRAFERSTDLSTRVRKALRERINQAAHLRAQQVTRIWRAEELSLSDLGQRLGFSKARADQLTRAGQLETPHGVDEDTS